MAELSALERLMQEDGEKSAAERFQDRIRQARILNGLETPVEDASATECAFRLSPALVARIAAALEGADDLEADMVRLALNLPMSVEDAVSAGRGGVDEMVVATGSVCSPTTRQCNHLSSGTRRRATWTNLGLRDLSVALAA